MRRFRTIRQRRRRANGGQVAAVATIFGLLLVVMFISVFVIQPLPGNMGALEYQHVLLVENQLARLQATVLAEAAHPGLGLALSSPVTLGSQALPPWAAPSSGSIAPESSLLSTQTNYGVAQVFSHPPNWNTGTSCLTGGSGHCAGNGNIDTWNVTNSNNSAFTLTVNGNSNSMQYNISGNNDTITVSWTGGDTGFVYFIINGSNDVVNYNKGGSDTNSPIATFLFYGQHDVFNFSPSGSHSSHGSMTLDVVFVGTVSEICPYGNLSSTDTLGTLGSGGSNLFMNVTWWNALGYASAPHEVTYPGGGGSNEHLTFMNNTGFVACAFTQTFASSYTQDYLSGILVQLNNHYILPATVAYDQGAVIESSAGGASAMVSPPHIIVKLYPSGYTAAVTLINFIGTFTETGGIATAAVTTRVLGVQTVTVQNGQSSFYLDSPLFLNITTAYPLAWYDYFLSQPTLFPGGATCTPHGTFVAPATCLTPPSGGTSQISAPLYTQRLTITTITLAVSVL
ncbi:MAG: hypothetical protein L3K17_00025 [Thermoplasmata archaeon]|nr:hypothetical protein [Thermoplasmata archaeon]